MIQLLRAAAASVLLAAIPVAQASPKSEPPSAEVDAVAAERESVDHMIEAVKLNMDSIPLSPYLYFLPSPAAPGFAEHVARLEAHLRKDVSSGVPPKSLLGFGGPSSDTTASFIVHNLSVFPEGSLAGSRVLFIGSRLDEARVAAAITRAGAEFRFVDADRPVMHSAEGFDDAR